jgi:hypothetical protein
MVKENELQAAVEPTVSAWRNDSPLSDRLIQMGGYHLTFPSFLIACQNMQSMPWPSEPELLKERSGLYNRATCFEFHRLLLSTLINYGKAHDELAGAHTNYTEKPNERNLVEMARHAKRIWEYGRLLWVIAYSRILEDHLGVLRAKGWLPLPVNEKIQLDRFSSYTGFKHKPKHIANLPWVKGDAGQSSGDTVRGCEDGAGQDDGDAVNGGEDAENDHENDETRSIIDDALLSDDKNFAKVYLSWIRLQVDRWQAPRKITTFVRHANQHTIDLNLLAVRHPEPMSIDQAMEPWKNTIVNLYAGTREGPKAKDVIRVLSDAITQMRGVPHSRRPEGVPHSIFSKFDPTCTESDQFNATVHCEAVLAALSKFPSRVRGDSTLRECLQV